MFSFFMHEIMSLFENKSFHYFFYLQNHRCFCYKTKASTDTGRVFFIQNLHIHQLVSVLPGWLVLRSTRGNNCIARYRYIPFCVVATSCPVHPMVTAALNVGLAQHTHNFLSQTNLKKKTSTIFFFQHRRSNIFSKTFSRNKMSNFFMISYHLYHLRLQKQNTWNCFFFLKNQ